MAALLDVLGDLEDRQVHRHQDRAHRAAEEDHHQGLHQRGERVDGGVHYGAAIAGDAAAGGTTFLNRLVDQLKQNGVLERDANVSNLTDVLEAMQETSRRSAAAASW